MECNVNKNLKGLFLLRLISFHLTINIEFILGFL